MEPLHPFKKMLSEKKLSEKLKKRLMQSIQRIQLDREQFNRGKMVKKANN